mgnify:CR=1 FL=1
MARKTYVLQPGQRYINTPDEQVDEGELRDMTPEEEALLDAEFAKIDFSKIYMEQRRYEYPNIGDQLDALFHAGIFPPEMQAKIQAVKDKYPKPQQG